MKEKKVIKKTNETSKKEKRNLIVGIAMMVFAVAIAVGTYAYYQTTITGTVSGTILAWDCKDGNITTGGFPLGNLKPGTSGTITFTILSNNFVTNKSVELKWNNSTNVPANFKLYTDSGHTTTVAMSTSFPGASSAQFKTNNVAKTTSTEYKVYWYWPYGTSAEDPLSTSTNKTLQIDYKITCTQADV